MKYKKIIAMSALVFALCGFGTEAIERNSHNRGNFYETYRSSEWHFGIYQDNETGVQYIVYRSFKGGGIIPRYNADGSLYQGGVVHE